ncbi:MAG: methionine--tRNA ligase [Candidatus Micrarchaeota archaeon]|nr:methionine--tRNA ligase [Candidatus Micrarchaeota archaeon]
MPKYYITTAIPYVNASPHLGHALEFIQTDVLARYHKLLGDDVYVVTGADENSLKNVQAAEAKGTTPEALCAENAALFRKLADTLGLSYSSFVRTSVSQEHKKGVQMLWELCAKSGDIYRKNYRGLYCVGCEAFYEEHQLENGMCPEHKKPLEIVEEENYFFRLSKYQKQLEEMIASGRLKVVPESRMNEMLHFIREGLQDFSISRSMKRAKGWGIPVPHDPNQIMYVWFDALGTYLTGAGYGSDSAKFSKYWPADVHVIGKGILRFHAIYWPVMLLSAGLQMPKSILVHGYITVEGEKMSKSLGNIVDPFSVVEKFGIDAFRYCLLSEVSTFEDGDFSEKVLIEKNNNELVANVGNLVNRTIVFAKNNFDGKVPYGPLAKGDEQFIALQKEKIAKASALLGQMRLKEAISAIMEFSSNANRYFQENEPWKAVKSDKLRAAAVLYVLANQVKDLAILLWPYIPHASDEIFRQLNVERPSWKDLGALTLKPGHMLGEPKPIFRKIDASVGGTPGAAQASRGAKPAKTQPPGEKLTIAGIDLEIGEILSVEKHPNAEKLFIEKVRLGDGERQIVSGLAQFYTPEELVGKKVIIVKNLKPARIRGVESAGMLLAAASGDEVEVLCAPDSRPGDKVVAEGILPAPRKEITIEEFGKVVLEVKGYELYAEGRKLLAAGRPIRALRVPNGKVG